MPFGESEFWNVTFSTVTGVHSAVGVGDQQQPTLSCWLLETSIDCAYQATIFEFQKYMQFRFQFGFCPKIRFDFMFGLLKVQFQFYL